MLLRFPPAKWEKKHKLVCELQSEPHKVFLTSTQLPGEFNSSRAFDISLLPGLHVTLIGTDRDVWRHIILEIYAFPLAFTSYAVVPLTPTFICDRRRRGCDKPSVWKSQPFDIFGIIWSGKDFNHKPYHDFYSNSVGDAYARLPSQRQRRGTITFGGKVFLINVRMNVYIWERKILWST